MNTGMWTAEATQRNVSLLRERGVRLIGPDNGILACGDSGAGRMSEPADIVREIENVLSGCRDLTGKKVLITAGATRERLDPVRFLSNDSSGKMGFALAEAARDRGADVTAVCGCVSVPVPIGIHTVRIESAMDLYDVMIREAPAHDLVIQAAAVADYRPETVSGEKIKKKAGEKLTLTLVENPDIAAAVGKQKKPGQILIGFAAETERLYENAGDKLKRKNLDMIVANDVTKEGAGFNVDTNIASILTVEGVTECPLQSKRELADAILTRAVSMMNQSASD